ncbi:UNVERIFIED_ORG: Mn2+/Fe2+ NRAMP family transporter [Arthrobacter sp. UYCu721]
MAVGQGMERRAAGPDRVWSAVAGVGIAVTLMTGSYGVIAKMFKWLCLALLAYGAGLFVAYVDWADVAEGLFGLQFRFSFDYLGLIVEVLGTTIFPYLFFWQSAHRIEELLAETLDGAKPPRCRNHPRRPRRTNCATRAWTCLSVCSSR